MSPRPIELPESGFEGALLLARQGEFERALTAIEAALGNGEERESRAAGAAHKGLKSLERAEWEEADSFLKRALNLPDPGLQRELESFHQLLEGGEPGRAARLLRDLLAKHEAYPDLHYLLGLAELELD